MLSHRLITFALAVLLIPMTVAIASPQEDDEKPVSRERKEKNEIKPYDEVITDDAQSKPGLFLTHQIGDDLFYEIPTRRLNKDMLWVTQLEKTQSGFSYGGMPVRDRVVRWELRGERVLLRDVKYSIRTSEGGAITHSVAASSVAPIIKVFPVKAWGKDKAPVIDVTSLVTGDISEFSPKRALNASSIDSGRTFLEEVKAFESNIETKVLATYKLSSTPAASPFGGGASSRDPSQSAVTVILHHSMLLLPEKPMTPRQHDARVGFFTVGFDDFGLDENHQVESIRLITRWRLEKTDPEADVSEVKQPIVFYVGRGVPDEWKPYVKKGIEAWQGAFENAGFKNAIVGKLAPSSHEDPDWDAEDARISTVRWLPSSTENAFGPHVHDPRTGEILEADVRVYHNVLKLIRDWYFIQASPSDPRAHKLPLPDDLVGELLAYVVAHEVGHSLGFPHNMLASSSYSVANLRDPEFTKKNGTEASIMDYGRFNYVAQPGDGAALIPVVGPYDYFAVDWGYRQYADQDAEKEGLDKLFQKQIGDAMLRFGNADPRVDPTRQTEDLGSDSIEATAMGLKNLDRVAGYLVEACCQPGDNYDLLENMFTQLVRQRNRELGHVTGVVGGFEQRNLYFGDADQIYHPIPGARQRQAVKFLLEHAFQTPSALVDDNITRRLETNGAADRIVSGQQSVLRSLVSEARIKRMAEHVERCGEADAYRPAEMLGDLRQGIWSELNEKNPTVNLYRRNLQRAHLDLLISEAAKETTDSDLPMLARSELASILGEIGVRKVTRGDDPETRAHLALALARIEKALDPKGD